MEDDVADAERATMTLGGVFPFANATDRMFSLSLMGAMAILLSTGAYKQAGHLPWAILSIVVLAYAAYYYPQSRASSSPPPPSLSPSPFNFPCDSSEGAVGGSNADDMRALRRKKDGSTAVFFPDLYAVHSMDPTMMSGQGWRGDTHLVRDLAEMRPFVAHDGHTVKTVLSLLAEFYRRYDRMFKRPGTLGVLKNEYTILRDINVATLNAVQALYFRKPMPLCRRLPRVTRAIMARTARMLRILRHKYPNELRGEQGGAPRGADPMDDTHLVHV
jgi:hypothetical protein